MTQPMQWSDMFRAHTCFKALVRMSEQMQAKDHANLRSESLPPCRACRAWWTQLCARFEVTVRFTWPGGSWGVPDAVSAPSRPHNEILAAPEARDDGFSLVAVENQSCALWAYRTSDVSADPEIYQTDLGDETHGPWRALGVRHRAFAGAMTVWNEANGGVLPSAVGQLSKDTAERLRAWRPALANPWFTVYEQGQVRVCQAGDDLYAWGADVDGVRHTIRTLRFAWSDLEWR